MLLLPGSVLAAQIQGEQSLNGILSATCGSYISVLASVLYVPSIGEGNARMPGRGEFWYEEELQQRVLAGSTATARVRLFWGTGIYGKPQVYDVHTGEGTPYENVCVANMQQNGRTQRYKFTPTYDVDDPLITWTPEGPEHEYTPSHTGNGRPPLEQLTILMTPTPDDTDTYTTLPFPTPDPKGFNDYILIFPTGPGTKPTYIYLKEDPQKPPGVVTRCGVPLSPGTRQLDVSVSDNDNDAPIPAHIADKLRGWEFKAFDEPRKMLRLEASQDPGLIARFSSGSQAYIK